MLLAVFVLMCVIGAVFILPVILAVVLFFLNRNSLMRAHYSEDFRTIFHKVMNDVQNRAREASQKTPDGTLSRKEAFEILGLSPDAPREQIISAYHRLMKNAHPDKGGSAYFAQKLNQARDKLLGQHK